MFQARAGPERINGVVQRALRPECVDPGPHVHVVVVEADTKGCEGEVAVEESDALLEMSRVRIRARP